MSRKLAREIAFKVVFSSNFQTENEDSKNLIEDLVNDKYLLEEKEAVENENVKEAIQDITSEDKKYIEEVIAGISDKITELDEKIKIHLKGWTMDRIGKTDLAILRLAIYEILYRDDIPYKVSINEAVELAKLFCDETSPAFINGVLAGVVNSLPKDEE